VNRRATTAYLVAALALLIAGLGLWTAGRFEQRVLGVETGLLTLVDQSPRDIEDIERSVSYLRNLPWMARLSGELREQRATAEYWDGDYSKLADDNSAAPRGDIDPAIALIAANASFRRIRITAPDPTVAGRLESVLGRYAEILRQRPEWLDAAYNYEIVARTRDRMARGAPPRPERKGDTHGAPPATIHGLPGAPVDDANPDDLKIMIPQRTDERRQQPDAGVGGPKPRKG
jgi:hypothetical protein